MMKKFISAIIGISVLLNSALVLAKENTKKSNVEIAVQLLQQLDMLNKDYDDSTIDGLSLMTKADVAAFAADVFAKDATSDVLYFHDVPRYYWAFEKISVLVDKNLLKVNAEKMFYPDDVATKQDLARIILYALGYGSYLDSIESPDIVDSLASNAKLYKNVSVNTKMTFGDMVIMLYNGLLSEKIDITGINNGGAIYSGSGKTFLEEKYSIYVEEGVLEGYNGMSTSSSKVKIGEAIISGEKYNCEIDLTELIGNTITYYYYYNEDLDEKTIISAELRKTGNTLELMYYDNELLFDSDTYSFKYTLDGVSRKTVRLSRTISVIYNGEFVSEGIESLLSGEFYNISLSKMDSESQYSTAIIWDYENYIVGALEKKEKGFYDKVTGNYISLENSENVTLMSDKGTTIVYEDIMVGDVLSVYSSISGNTVKVVQSRLSVEGKVTVCDENFGYRMLTVNEIQYRSAKKLYSDMAKISENVVLYLDAYGLVAEVKHTSGSSQIGYLISVKYSEENDQVILKIFNESGETEKTAIAEKVKIDGSRYIGADRTYSLLENIEPQLIVYNKNADGMINSIDTKAKGANESDNSLHINMPYGDYVYRNGPGRMGNKMYLNDETKIFVIPINPKNADKDKFFIKSKNDIIGDRSYYCSSYSTSTEVQYEEVILFDGYDWSANEVLDTPGLLVTKITSMVNSDDEVVSCFTGYKGNSIISLMCEETCDVSKVKVGDYITYSLSRNNEICDLVVRYSPNNSIKPYAIDIYSEVAITSGYVNKIRGNLVQFGRGSGADYDDLYDFSRGTVLVYDREINEVSVGDKNDLVSYEISPLKASFVMMHMRYSNPLVYIIYK